MRIKLTYVLSILILGALFGLCCKTGTTYTWDDADGTIAAYAELLKPN